VNADEVASWRVFTVHYHVWMSDRWSYCETVWIRWPNTLNSLRHRCSR